jgi:hypothetical protein
MVNHVRNKGLVGSRQTAALDRWLPACNGEDLIEWRKKKFLDCLHLTGKAIRR